MHAVHRVRPDDPAIDEARARAHPSVTQPSLSYLHEERIVPGVLPSRAEMLASRVGLPGNGTPARLPRRFEEFKSAYSARHRWPYGQQETPRAQRQAVMDTWDGLHLSEREAAQVVAAINEEPRPRHRPGGRFYADQWLCDCVERLRGDGANIDSESDEDDDELRF